MHLEQNTVLAHEHTRLEPKEDRLRLLQAVKANLSPIFVLFSDKRRVMNRINEQYASVQKPDIDIYDKDRIRHRLWRIDSPVLIKKIQEQIHEQNLFIADGHHRYEVARAYREQMQKRKGALLNSNYDYIMAYFTNIESKGLLVMPVHRLVRKINLHFEIFRKRLGEFFEIEQLNNREDFFFMMKKSGLRQHTLGIYKDKIFYMLRLKNSKLLDKIAVEKSKEFRTLDVAILNYLIFQQILNIDFEDKQRVNFSHNTDFLIREADNHKDSILFLLNPVPVEKMMKVALRKERLPAKSTYFYPKVLSGLVIHKFNSEG
jgi:uncharacterized protein (DUF1015 family)